MTGRAVRVKSQLRSHKSFATAFLRYCQLVDNARLYCTNALGGPPKLIAQKDGDGSRLLVDPEDIKCLTNVTNLKADADNVYDLHPNPSPIWESGSVWKEIVSSPTKHAFLYELKSSIIKLEHKK